MSLALKLVRRMFVGLLAVIGALVTLVVVVILLRVPLSLGFGAAGIETAASKSLGRPVVIEGPIRLTPSLWPVLEISGLRISNPPRRSNGAFLELSRLRAEIELIPILRGQIRIRQTAIAGLRLHMARQPTGEANWPCPGSAGGKAKATENQPGVGPRPFEIQHLSVEDAVLSLQGGESDQAFEMALDRVTGEARLGRAVRLTAAGSVQHQPFAMSLSGDPLTDLLPPRQPWAFQLTARVGTNDLDLGGTWNGGQPESGVLLKARLTGERIADLAAFTGAHFPLAGAFSLEADLSCTAAGVELHGVGGDLAGNRFTGAGTVDFSGPRPRLGGYLDAEWLAAAARTDQLERMGGAGPRLELELSGERLGPLSAWTGVRPGSRLGYALRGRLDITEYRGACCRGRSAAQRCSAITVR